MEWTGWSSDPRGRDGLTRERMRAAQSLAWSECPPSRKGRRWVLPRRMPARNALHRLLSVCSAAARRRKVSEKEVPHAA